jgi:hypothetical protein
MKIEGEKRVSSRFKVPKGYRVIRRGGEQLCDSWWVVERGEVVIDIRFYDCQHAVDWAWFDVRDRATKAAQPDAPDTPMALAFKAGVRHVNDQVRAQMHEAGYNMQPDHDARWAVRTLLGYLGGVA